MSKILIKFPTRNRPDKFKNVLEKTIKFLSGNHNVRFIITMDEDDLTMNNKKMKSYLKRTRKNGTDIVYHYGTSKTKVEACNANLEGENADIVVLLSDDMVPCFDGFDELIVAGMEEHFPNMDGAIKFNDGLRGSQDLLMTLPVIGWKLYEAMGHLYHPSYTSVFCDNEMTHVCMMLNKLAVSPACLFRHEWTHKPFDELHARNENEEMYRIDGAIFEGRKANNFDIGKISLT